MAAVAFFAALKVQAYFDPSIGRWASRDPAQETGGQNLYAFAKNDGINWIDALGLWEINRNGDARASAIPAKGDTVTALAQMYRLDDKDFSSWLKPVNGSRMPTSPTEPIDWCPKYTVPNTVYIEFGEMHWWDYMGPIPSWQRALQSMATGFKSDGFNVVLNNPSSAGVAQGDLASDTIYGFAYAGHGGGAGNLIFNDQNNASSTLGAGRQTQYGIAFLMAYGCETANQHAYSPAMATLMGYSYSPWEKSVSTRGWFTGVYGSVNIYQAWSSIIIASGTNRK